MLLPAGQKMAGFDAVLFAGVRRSRQVVLWLRRSCLQSLPVLTVETVPAGFCIRPCAQDSLHSVAGHAQLMADIRAAHPEDDIFGDIGGMVGDALQIARNDDGA